MSDGKDTSAEVQNGENNNEQGSQEENDKTPEKVDSVPHQAFHAEREKRKSLEAELAEIKKLQAEAEEEKKRKQGEFEELANQKTAEVEKLTAELEELRGKVSSFEEVVESRVEEALNAIKSEDDRALMKEALDGKSAAQKDALLPKLIQKFGTPANINHTIKGGETDENKEPKTVEAKRQQQLEEAKKKGDAVGMITNAPTIQ